MSNMNQDLKLVESIEERLIRRSVPQELAELYSELLLELLGAANAQGWERPRLEALFLASILLEYSERFRELAGGNQAAE